MLPLDLIYNHGQPKNVPHQLLEVPQQAVVKTISCQHIPCLERSANNSFTISKLKKFTDYCKTEEISCLLFSGLGTNVFGDVKCCPPVRWGFKDLGCMR